MIIEIRKGKQFTEWRSGIWYNVSPTQAQHFTISKVAVDWHSR